MVAFTTVLGVVGAQALSANVPDADCFHDSADSAAGDDAGALRSGLQEHGTGAEDANDLMGNGGAGQSDLNHILLGIGNALQMASETSAALPRP